MNLTEDTNKYAYWLYRIPGLGSKTIETMLSYCNGDVINVYHTPKKAWKMVLEEKQYKLFLGAEGIETVEEEYQKMQEAGIRMVVRGEKGYPSRLEKIWDPPYVLFYVGILPEEERLSVALIGARDCSTYGSYVAESLGAYLGQNGVQVISGMARGIDGIGQRAALDAGGTSFAVLGCGVDICYPRQNKSIYDVLKERGGVLSSYLPGTMAKAQHFPPRNRIVSALSDAVVVVEAREKSGTLITVDMALEQGKDVYVTPGRITDRLSDGCNRLLEQGAGVVLSPKHFLEELLKNHGDRRCGAGRQMGDESVRGKIQKKLSDDLAQVYDALDFSPQSVDAIMAKMPEAYGCAKLNASLMQLCLLDYVGQPCAGFYTRKI
ncbi:MAG: DNA-processing protein DprA [Acetatifactor sp.]|nr:DNA-processing protein DprA [Acetatifactor sp.]